MPPAAPVVSHLQSLFTVPPSVIISVSSIMDAYSSKASDSYLPDFYGRVNSILTAAFPHDVGLARNGMGLVPQDVVIASFLMVEDCLHSHRGGDGLFDGDSEWGPYLDVLPRSLIPRLDSFQDGDYAALADGMLERAGRESLATLIGVYGDANGGGGMRGVVADMVKLRTKAGAGEVPPSCVSFEAFHRFVAVVSSRAMVLGGVKHLTPLADMINYSPRPRNSDDGGGREGVRREVDPPFTLYHSLGRDGGITVRSDRDVHLGGPAGTCADAGGQAATESSPEPRVIQLFEDYGPVDSSLFLEAHGFVPRENPHNCATVPGNDFLRRPVPTSGVVDPNLHVLLKALKTLGLIHPQASRFVSPEDVCVRSDLTLVDDGSTAGIRPASDAIAVTSLLLGSSGGDVWGPLGVNGRVLSELKDRCRAAVESGDRERTELRCARYHGPHAGGGGRGGRPLNKAVVEQTLRVAARRTLEGHARRGDDGTSLRARLEGAESRGDRRGSVALRFRLEEDGILAEVAGSSPVEIGDFNADGSGDLHESDNTASDLVQKLARFNDFVASLGLPVNKIEARLVESGGMRLGAFATEDVALEDVYVSLQPDSVIDASTAVADAEERTSPRLAGLLRRTDEAFSSRDGGFDAMMLYLLHERFVTGEESRWWPYLDILPTIDDMRNYHPLFLSEWEADAGLGGSDVRRLVLSYRRRFDERHALLASDPEALAVLGPDVLLDGDRVRWAAAVLDSRSVWWDGRRHLAPLLDLVNADGAGRPHETKVEDMRAGHAATRASRAVAAGEQVFENYGQPNHLLYGYHGFALADNPHDCAVLDGLYVGRDDPGAGSPAARLLLSTAPRAFCVAAGDGSSLDELARFLRVKHGLRPDDSDGSFLGRDVRHLILDVLRTRAARLADFVEVAPSESEGAEGGESASDFMSAIRRNELGHLTEAIELLQGDD